jgi:hypothetical protein
MTEILNKQISNQDNTHEGVMSVLFNNAPTQAGVMVGIVNAISQPFSQPTVIEALSLADKEWSANLPIQITLFVSFLLAIYQTKMMQRTRFAESLIVIPIVTGILFGMSMGANSVGEEVFNPQASSEVPSQQLEIANQENLLEQEMLDLQNKLKQLQDKTANAHIVASRAAPISRGIPELIALNTESVRTAEKQLSEQTKAMQAKQIKQQIELLRKKKQVLELKRKKLAKPGFYKTW